MESPGGWSDSSRYSNPESAPSRIHRARTASLETEGSSSFHADYRNMFDSQRGEPRRPLLDQSTVNEERDGRCDDARLSIASGATYRGANQDDLYDPTNRTPMPPGRTERVDLPGPQPWYPRQTVSPTLSERTRKQTTPTRTAFSKAPSPTHGAYTPNGGRLAFVAPSDVSRGSIDALEKEVQAAQDSDRMNVRVAGRGEAPASHGEIGPVRVEDEDMDTVKGPNRLVQRATMSSSNGASTEAMLSPQRDDLSTQRSERTTPTRHGSEETPLKKGSRERSPSPARSPEPPPRSIFRKPYVSLERELALIAAGMRSLCKIFIPTPPTLSWHPLAFDRNPFLRSLTPLTPLTHPPSARLPCHVDRIDLQSAHLHSTVQKRSKISP